MLEQCTTVRRLFRVTTGGLAVLAAAWSSAGIASTIEVTDLPELTAEADAGGMSGTIARGIAPYLYLTPRVASILQDVFADSKTTTPAASTTVPDETEGSNTSKAEPEDRQSVSPVAENAGSGATTAPANFDNAAVLPRFQRQMYRTDI